MEKDGREKRKKTEGRSLNGEEGIIQWRMTHVEGKGK